jgi:hypothetical protein
VAGEDGNDKSIVLTLQGPKMTGLKEMTDKNTVQLGDLVAGQVRTALTSLPMDTQFQIGVDTIGIGRGVYFHLTDVQRLRHVHMIDVSQKALDERRYHRLRDQIWWELREAFVETREIVILNDDELIGQLTSIKWGEVDGRIKIQGKGGSSGIPGVPPLSSSPDKADALAMAWWLYKHFCSRMPEGAVAKRLRRDRHPCRHTRAGPRQDPHRDGAQDIAPTAPAVELHEVVSPHQPDEFDTRIDRPQPVDGIGGPLGAQGQFQSRDLDAQMAFEHRVRPRQPLGHRGRLTGFQRVARGHQPPDLIQPHPLHRLMADMGMPLMGRVKRPAQKANDHALRRYGKPRPHGPSRIRASPSPHTLPLSTTIAT